MTSIFKRVDGCWKIAWMQYAEFADLVIGITCRNTSGISNAMLEVKDKLIDLINKKLLLSLKEKTQI